MGLFDGLFGGGREQPESEQLRQVRAEPFVAMLGAKLLDGCEALKGAVGRFGYDADNPIPVNGVVGEITYLNTLRGRSGAGVLFHRLSSTKCSVSPHPVDVYEVVTVDGSQWATLHFSMYHPRRSLRAPADFTRMPWSKIPKEARAMIHLPAMGSHSRVEDFPMGLPAAVRSSPLLRALSPGLGDAMARGVERILGSAQGRWTRPQEADHAGGTSETKRSSRIAGGSVAPKDSIDALISVAVAKGLIPEDRDLGMIPELMPMFERASKAFHGIVVQSMERAALDRRPQDGLAVMQRSCMYLFGKGVQAVMLWGASKDGQIGLDFEPGDMIRMQLDPVFELDPEDNKAAADSMAHGLPLFAAHQAFMERAMAQKPAFDEAFVREEMSKTLEWVPRVAISYALMKGYHRS